MATKIYKVIKHIIYDEDYENIINVKVFTDEKLASMYYKQLIAHEKEYAVELDLEDYTIDESENYYERYLTGFASQNSVTISLEEDEICEKLEKPYDMEKEYEI